MKFLVLALCVCAASAAVFPGYKPYSNPAVVAPAVAAEVVYNAVAPAAKTVAQAAYTAGKEAEAAVVRQALEVSATGFTSEYETQNGIAAQSSGEVKRVGDVDALVTVGSYRYVAPDGTPVVVTYKADENGFQPQSDILPVGPAIPEAIVRSLEYLAAYAKPVESDKKY